MKATRGLLGKRVNAAQLRDRSRQPVVVDTTDELSIHIDFHGWLAHCESLMPVSHFGMTRRGSWAPGIAARCPLTDLAPSKVSTLGLL